MVYFPTTANTTLFNSGQASLLLTWQAFYAVVSLRLV